MARPKATYATQYIEQTKPGEWSLFFVPARAEADKTARWCRREGFQARLLELDDRTLLAIKPPTNGET